MKEVATCCLVALLAFSGRTETFVWTNVVSASANWLDVENWTDAEGRPIPAAPAGATDDVVFSPLGTVLQTVSFKLPNGSSTWSRTDLATMTGADPYARRTVQLSGEKAWLSIGSPNAYEGLWTTASMSLGLSLPATATAVPVLSCVSPAKRLEVEVPAAGTKAVVSVLSAGGTVVKKGAGELEVGQTAGSETQFHVSGGTLTLAGHDAGFDCDRVPVAGAWLHLDASCTNTMSCSPGDDGRTYVTSWADVRGNGVFAYPSETVAPFLNDAIVAGKTVMDFGRVRETEDPSLGPIGASMTFSERQVNVREVFCVACIQSTVGDSVVFGDTKSYPFLRASSRIAWEEYEATHPVVYGDIIVDGKRVSNATSWPRQQLGTVSVGTTNAIALSLLGSDRLMTGRSGGVRIAEALLYTNALTHAERLSVHRYLQRKWTAGGCLEAVDANAVTLASGETAISVPEGRVATVAEVTAISGTLVKKGAGELRIGTLKTVQADARRVSPKVDVRGGKVSFGCVPAVKTDEMPADGAYLWLKADSGIVLDGGAGAGIAEWKDCRPGQTQVSAVLPVGDADYKGCLPTLATGTVRELPVVDFGEFGKSSSSAYLKITDQEGAVRSVYEAFVVQAFTKSVKARVFGSSTLSFYPGDGTKILSSEYGTAESRNAVWTFNGAVVDPLQAGEAPFALNEYSVVSVSASDPLVINSLGGKDRTVAAGGEAWGGMRTGELIVYDRRLTPEERRQTVAYLMKKWRGASSPASQGSRVTTLSFDADKAAVVDVSDDLRVGGLAGGNGKFEKRGTGTFTVPSLNGVSEIAVSGGVLRSSLVPVGNMAFHFDASDIGSLGTFVVSDGASGLKTNVLTMVSQKDPAFYAQASISASSPQSPSYPALCTCETASGVWRQVLDFGLMKNETSASMQFMTDGVRTRMTDIREVHAVWCDHPNGSKRDAGQFFGDWNGYNYMRSNENRYLHKVDSLEALRTGYVALDGTTVPSPQYTDIPAGFHLISMAPLNADSALGAIARERNVNAGGGYLGEMIAFTTALGDAERKYLQKSMMHKWFGTAMPVWTNVLDRLDVASGARLVMEGNALEVVSCAGAGQMSVASLNVSGQLELTADDPLVVGGAFVQGGQISATVAVSAGVAAGDHEILRAESYENLDVSSWTLNGSFPRKYVASLVFRNGVICLHLEPKGMVLIVR